MRVLLVVPLLVLLAGCSADPEPEELSVTWGEDRACVAYPDLGKVGASLVATGEGEATVRVVAYADEDTTTPVGAGTLTVSGPGPAEVTFDVSAAPFVDVDGVAACTIDVQR